MKKSFKILLTVTIMLLTMTLVSCSLLTNATSIELSTMPKSVYNLNEEIDDFAIVVNYDDGVAKKVEFTKSNPNGITIVNFDTSSAGTKTATIKYMTFTISFDYTVVDTTSGFAAGNGTKEYPYEVKTTEQLMLICDSEFSGSYFEITANISIDATTISGTYIIKGSEDQVYGTVFSGYIDGNHHKITIKTKDDAGIITIFEGIKNAEIVDLDIHSEGSVVAIAENATGSVILRNVNRFGTAKATRQNSANYLIYTGYSDIEAKNNDWEKNNDIQLIDCNNYCSITSVASSSSGYFAAYIGYPFKTGGDNSQYVVNITFNNCNNYGNLVGPKAGVLCANNRNNTNISVTNCNNYGSVEYGLSYNYIFAANKDGKVEVSIESLKEYSNSFTYQNYVKQTAEFTGYTIDESNNQIVLNVTDDQIATVTVAAYFETHDGVTNNKKHIVTKEFEVEKNVEKETGLYNLSVIAKADDQEYDTNIFVDLDVDKKNPLQMLLKNDRYDSYVFTPTDAFTIAKTSKMYFTISAYDVSGKLLSVAYFTQK